MSIRRDHILRLIERAGPVLKKIFGLREMQQRAQSAQSVRDACRELLDLDLGLVLAMPTQSLLQLLTIDEGSGVGRCMVAAELMRAQAELAAAAGDAGGARDLEGRADVLQSWVAAQPGGREYVDAFTSLRSHGPNQA